MRICAGEGRHEVVRTRFRSSIDAWTALDSNRSFEIFASGKFIDGAESLMSKARSQRTKGDRRRHQGARGVPPVPHEWRYEAELYDEPSGTNYSAKTRLRRWRIARRIWARPGPDGRLMVAVHKDDRDHVIQREEVEMQSIVGRGESADQGRHRELEVRLRSGPYLKDGNWGKAVIRFTLTLDEWEEPIRWRAEHGWGEEFGTRAMRTYSRLARDSNVSLDGEHAVAPLRVLVGRALD